MASVSFRDLCKCYGDQTIVEGFDLEVAEGEFVVLIGPSGCGKSTILRMLAGLEPVSSGEIRIGNQAVNHLHPRDRDIAMVFQDYALYPHKTVRDNLGFGLKMRKVPAQEAAQRVNEAAQLLGITHLLDRRPAQLSGGQRQRVAMGRAMVRRPKVFLFDEPLSNLDAKLRMQLRTEIRKLHQEFATTTIYVTHDQVEAMTLADRMVIMRNGRIEQSGAPATLYSHPSNMFVGGFIGAPAMNFLPAENHALTAVCGGGIRLDLSGFDTVIGQRRNLVVGMRPEHLDIGPEGQGDVIFHAQSVLSEDLGADALVYFDAGGPLISARVSHAVVPPNGQQVRVSIASDKIRLFDADSQNALF